MIIYYSIITIIIKCVKKYLEVALGASVFGEEQ